MRRIVPREGLFYGWWVVFACAGIVLFAGGTFFYGFGILFDPIREEFGWSALMTTIAFSLRSEVGAIAAPLSGVLVDRLGPRKVIQLGLLIVCAGFVALSQVHSLLTFYAAFAFIAIGNSAAGGHVGIVAVSWWFVRKRSRALSLMTFGAGLSGITVPILAWLVGHYGWRDSLIVLAAAIFLACLPLTFLIRERPEKYGLLPDGVRLDNEPNAIATKQGVETALQAQVQSEALRGRSISVREALKNRSFWHLAVAMSLTNMASTPVVILLIPALTNTGIDASTAALASAAIPLFSLPARVMFGWWGDYADKRKLLASCFALQTVGMLILSGISTPLLLAPFVIIFSPGFGGPIPLRPALQADYFGLESMGTIQGLLQFIATIGGVLGPIFVGAMVDLTGTYRTAFFALALVGALAIPLVLHMPKNAGAPSESAPAFI